MSLFILLLSTENDADYIDGTDRLESVGDGIAWVQGICSEALLFPVCLWDKLVQRVSKATKCAEYSIIA